MKSISKYILIAPSFLIAICTATAVDEIPCCPAPTGLEICCGGTVMNPSLTNTIKFTIDVTELFNKAKNVVNRLQAQGSGCKWQDTGALTVEASLESHDECCNPNNPSVKTVYTGTGSGTFNFGTWTCRWNALGTLFPEVPSWAAQLYAEASAGFSINLGNISIATTCEHPTVCHGPVAGVATLSAGLGGEVGEGFIKLECSGSGTGTLGTKLCFSDTGFYLDEEYATVDSLTAGCKFDIGAVSFTLVEVDLLKLGSQ